MKTFVTTAMRAALLWASLALIASQAHAQRAPAASYRSDFKTVQALLQQSEPQLDLAVVKLTVDRMIDPSIDVAATTKQIDDLAAEVRATIPPGAPNLVKFKALRDYLYRLPLLSGRQPYLYNFEDDRGLRAKLLPVYLDTHRGNCVSMPTLFVILGQKLGIPVTLTTAPEHLYMKFGTCNTLAVVTTIFIPAVDAVDESEDQEMIIKIALGSFYSRGDERRLFAGFKEIAAIRSVQGVGRDLLLDIEVAGLTQEAMREMLALLWRYGISIVPLRVFAERKKFSWLNDPQGYWHSAMFKDA